MSYLRSWSKIRKAIPESVRKLVNAVADDVIGTVLEPITGRIQ